MRNRRSARLLTTFGTFVFVGIASLGLARPARAQVVFEPAFHQALYTSVTTSTRTTYRMKIPVGRGGSRMRISFRAGDGALNLHAATVALAATQGNLASPPVAITFNGSPGFTANAQTRVTSDPIALPVTFGNEVYVSFDVDGTMGASNINNFPDSYAWAGGSVTAQNPSTGAWYPRLVAVDTIDVEGPSTIAMVALGDSITEGYVSGGISGDFSRNDNIRDSWAAVAQGLLGVPVVNAAVSGQGVFDATARLQHDVFTMQGLTDCLVLIGTNDLGGNTAEAIEAGLSTLFDDLRPVCRVWAGTLLPKEQNCCSDYATVVARRSAVNDWIRHQAKVNGVIDFEPVLAQPGNVNQFAPGLGADGIHPTVAGQLLMGKEAARVLSPIVAPHIEAVRPASGSSSGGTTVEITGVNFVPGSTVTIGGVPATHVQVSASSDLKATAGPHDVGPASIVVTNPDGRSATLAVGFTYVDSPDASPQSQFGLASGGCSSSRANPSLLLLVAGMVLVRWRGSRRRRAQVG